MSIDCSNDPLLRTDKLNLEINIMGVFSSFLNSYEVSSLTLKNSVFTSQHME